MNGTTAIGIGSLLRSMLSVLCPTYVGGPANAAYSLVTLACASADFCSYGFVVRKQPKNHGLTGAIDGSCPMEGSSVVLLEDVITTGGSLVPSIKFVEEAKANLLAIIPVVDRNEGDHPDFAQYRHLVQPLLTKEDFRV